MLVHVLLAVECPSECVFTKMAYKANEWSSIIRRSASICTNTLVLSVQVWSIHYWFRMSYHTLLHVLTYLCALVHTPVTESSRSFTCPAVTILYQLLPLCDSSYWLTKVELLQTLACLEFTSLAVTDNQLPHRVLKGIVFTLLADSDHRYACAVLIP